MADGGGVRSGLCQDGAFAEAGGELAVAGGLGLRVDLSFFIFRFDVGMKLRYNAPASTQPNPPESAWWNDFRGLSSKDLGLNLGLGFPF